MKFTDTQKQILKKAYKVKKYTKKLHNRIINEDIGVLNNKLNKIGYKLCIKVEEN